MKNTLANIVQKLLKKNGVSFDKEELSFQIQSHPSYPSIHAITGVLDHFTIENVAAEVPADQETLVQLPDCFIAQINSDQGEELVHVERKRQEYLISNGNNQETKYTESKFLDQFTGILIAAEAPEDDNTITNPKNADIIKHSVIGILIVLIGYIIYKSEPSMFAVLHFALSVIGGIVSLAIIRQELGIQTTIGNAFCANTNEKTDCDSVLSSKGAEIIKGYKLSDLSMLYFSITLLLTLAFITDPRLPYAISILALPITMYSIYYQYKVVKKWCILCLSIVSVLWLQAVVVLLANTVFYNFAISDLIPTTIIIISVWLVWYYAKPMVTENKKLKKDKIESNRFKRNFDVFDSLLQKSPQLGTYIVEDQGILFGNPEALIEIVLVTNPFCGHCKPVHQQMHDLLNRYGDQIKIKVRFNVATEDDENPIVKITTSLLQLYRTEGEKVCLAAMDEIYEGMAVEEWLERWEISIDKEVYIDELKKQQLWCINNLINFTPQILINGKAFPKEYQRQELEFFIEELEENIQQKQPNTSIKYYNDTILFN
ncbi:vitamin K epoxide reductase family protein [Aquimarina sp. 2201CG1-2-11]|uniref:vitamin K epoxide reductase family protein n=1 Tax=Aquimarina discodermiae TaxID=3231043 RepID=UPI00346277D0